MKKTMSCSIDGKNECQKLIEVSIIVGDNNNFLIWRFHTGFCDHIQVPFYNLITYILIYIFTNTIIFYDCTIPKRAIYVMRIILQSILYSLIGRTKNLGFVVFPQKTSFKRLRIYFQLHEKREQPACFIFAACHSKNYITII